MPFRFPPEGPGVLAQPWVVRLSAGFVPRSETKLLSLKKKKRKGNVSNAVCRPPTFPAPAGGGGPGSLGTRLCPTFCPALPPHPLHRKPNPKPWLFLALFRPKPSTVRRDSPAWPGGVPAGWGFQAFPGVSRGLRQQGAGPGRPARTQVRAVREDFPVARACPGGRSGLSVRDLGGGQGRLRGPRANRGLCAHEPDSLTSLSRAIRVPVTD